MERQLLYYVVFAEDSEIEGRRFYEGEKYPVYKKNGSYVILVAENGEFCFGNDLMDQAIEEWNLTVDNK